MFNYVVKYTTSPGSMIIQDKEFKCKAWTKWGGVGKVY